MTIESEEAGIVSKTSPVVLYDSQFLDPFHNVALLIASTSSDAKVTWSPSSTAVTTSSAEPNYASTPTIPVPTAPPNGIFVSTGHSYGSAIISAFADSPKDRASITVLHYASLALGCRLRYYPAWDFSLSGGSGVGINEAMGADLYDTIPSEALGKLDICYQTPLAVSGSADETWHVPNGGTLIPTQNLTAFVAIQASQWRNDATSFSAAAGPQTLVFKTKAGLTVKVWLPIGPYEISDQSGHFTY